MAQVKPAVTPHSLRRSYATYQYRGGVSKENVKKLIGHSKMSTTELYIIKGPDQTKQLLQKYKTNLSNLKNPRCNAKVNENLFVKSIIDVINEEMPNCKPTLIRIETLA